MLVCWEGAKQNGAMNQWARKACHWRIMYCAPLRTAHSTDRYRAGLAWAPSSSFSGLSVSGSASCLLCLLFSYHPILPCHSACASASSPLASGLTLGHFTYCTVPLRKNSFPTHHRIWVFEADEMT